MRNHTDLLNYLADTFKLTSYLEVGVQNPRNNYDLIKIEYKDGVDPNPYLCHPDIAKMTSDEYFEKGYQIKPGFDLIFIDGDHTAQQVKRDFENSLKCLTDNGFIVIHDTNPAKEEHTHVPRDSKVWNGDVYKFACSLKDYIGIEYLTVNIDFGCTVVWYKRYEYDTNRFFAKGDNVNPVTTWQEFLQNKHLLNLVSVEQFQDHLHSNFFQLRTA